ncbi:hypothetical protein VN12_21020 [Pirellula sp. SH-Sr6A]|uniref:hypothetical protein n=1 Tax=Pirellula sp. SH-Sr6A TaxID=1632865 RepID=UPI00078B32E2|nr:hypothetical protein [Pirellula sp. SH-Sr6A]AMV34620.1 hypothetical protein VN12_21020 [Pirellula sp. SH-Sr6A]
MVLASLKKPFLISLIVSIVLAACIGIVIVLIGRFSPFEARILFSTLVIAGGSLGGLACSPGLRRELFSGRDLFVESVAILGVGLSLLATLFSLVLIWSDRFVIGFWQTNMVLVVSAIACGHIVLLSLARLASRVQWLQFVARGGIIALAILISMMILAPASFFLEAQVLAVLSIFVTAMTTTIPVMHKLHPAEVDVDVSTRSLDRSALSESLQQLDAEIDRVKARLAELEAKRAKIIRG